MFGQSFSLKFKDGSEAVPTVAGLLVSIILPLMLFSYGYQKFDNFVNKKDATLFSTDLINAIPESEVFDTSMGLKIAVAFTEWGDLNAPLEPILDESYGRIAFYRESYGFDANNTFFYKHEELPSH